MRIAVISDVHGNLPALESVLHDIACRGADAIWCLGDIAFKGPTPAECIQLLRDRGPSASSATRMSSCSLSQLVTGPGRVPLRNRRVPALPRRRLAVYRTISGTSNTWPSMNSSILPVPSERRSKVRASCSRMPLRTIRPGRLFIPGTWMGLSNAWPGRSTVRPSRPHTSGFRHLLVWKDDGKSWGCGVLP